MLCHASSAGNCDGASPTTTTTSRLIESHQTPSSLCVHNEGVVVSLLSTIYRKQLSLSLSFHYHTNALFHDSVLLEEEDIFFRTRNEKDNSLICCMYTHTHTHTLLHAWPVSLYYNSEPVLFCSGNLFVKVLVLEMNTARIKTVYKRWFYIYCVPHHHHHLFRLLFNIYIYIYIFRF